MIPRTFPHIFAIALLALSSTLASGVVAKTQPNQSERIVYAPPKSFLCNVRELRNGRGNARRSFPATMARTDEGDVVIYYWTQPYYTDSGEDALTRCTRVAGIFDTFNRRGNLDLIKTGQMNGRSVICAADSPSGPCQRLIFPLRPNENPDEVLRDLREVFRGRAIAVSASGSQRPLSLRYGASR